MSCEWEPKLDAYVDGELTEADRTMVQAHLSECASCATGALTRLQTKRMNQAAGQRYRATPEFRMKIERTAGGGKRASWLQRWAPVMAIALLLALGGVWQQYSRGDEATKELADMHVSTLASANPVDVVSTDRHTVKPWFQGKLPFSFNLPELGNSEFQLMGGRITYLQQNPGAQLLFAVRKHEISVFIFQDQGAASRLYGDGFLQGRLAFNSDTWTLGGLRYFVVGDCSREDIRDLSKLLRGQSQMR